MRNMRGSMNKRKILTWILRLAGIAVILYPLTLRVLSGLNQSEAIAGYEDSAAYYNQEMVAEEWEKAEEYNKSLSGTEVRDPFVPGSGVVIPDNYMEVLNIDRGIMGTLDIPCVDINLPIYHTVDAEVDVYKRQMPLRSRRQEQTVWRDLSSLIMVHIIYARQRHRKVISSIIVLWQ